jgi:hypothetical protein
MINFNNQFLITFFTSIIIVNAVGCSSNSSETNDGSGGTPSNSAGGTTQAVGGTGSGGTLNTSGTMNATGSSTTENHGLPPPHGTFTFELKPPVIDADPSLSNPGYTSFGGIVRDGDVLDSVVWTKAQEVDGCVLYKPEVPFCSSCDSPKVCTGEEECKSTPQSINFGSITVSGVSMSDGTTTFSTDPVAPKMTYSAPLAIAYPPAAAGTFVKLTGNGGDYPDFELQVPAITPLELLGDDPTPMKSAQPLPVRWTPNASVTGVRIGILVNISHHGGASGKIVCDVEDTGTFDVPATLVTRLLELGYSGFPTVEVTREAIATKAISEGKIQFGLISSAIRNLAIDGMTSCKSNADCANGQTCLPTTKRCG